MPHVRARETPFSCYMRVVNADTGDVYSHVVEADSDERWFSRIETDEHGRPKVDPAGEHLVIKRVLDTNIRIEINEGRIVDKSVDRYVPWNPDPHGFHQIIAAAP
ncbi:hypothetical protein OIU34_02370 [Pararhizobium sp. BT-229]|uniref:hypothetical protein n=1 Tax=Pararhizobium sp. BT-229 TaxID=2986923 RepID=UPI0021F6D593|nr:hypothetical protein [Pararhizobium sp. BT-229]MCV9960732.1 hypothetical protein [Pararhizobium sp. BT-229]